MRAKKLTAIENQASKLAEIALARECEEQSALYDVVATLARQARMALAELRLAIRESHDAELLQLLGIDEEAEQAAMAERQAAKAAKRAESAKATKPATTKPAVKPVKRAS